MTDGSKERAQRRPVDARIIMAGLFLVAMIPLLVTPVLPLIDHYNHLARFHVLAHIGSDPLLQQNYRMQWSVMPDIGADIFATPLLRFMSPLAAGHVIVASILALLYGGVLYFNHALTKKRSLLVAVLLLPLLYSYILNWGFINFLLGLGFVFWAAGWWLENRDRPSLGVPVACVLAVLIFATHGVAFAMYGILLVSLEIGIFLKSPVRNRRDLVRALALVGIQAVIPVLLFFWWRWHVVPPTVPEFSGGPLPPPPHDGHYRLKTILRVEEGPAYWFDVTTLAIQAIVASLLIWRGRINVARSAWPLIAICVLLVAVTPSKMFGAFYISDRVPLFAALCLLGALSIVPMQWNRWTRVACGILVATVFVRIGAIAADWHGYGRDYREFQSVATKIPPGSMTLGVMVGSGHHEAGLPRCEMYGPLLVMNYGQIGPTFDDPNQHPLVLAGPLKKATDSLAFHARVTNEMTADFNPYMIAAADAGFDHLLVCNPGLLTHAFPAGMDVVARTPRFALLRVNHK